MNKERIQNANEKTRKILKYLVASGTLLTALNAIRVLLEQAQANEINFQELLVGIVYTIAFMVINTAIYYIIKLSEKE